MSKLGYLLCCIGIHRLHPARIVMDETQTRTHYRQCMRCGCLVHRVNATPPSPAPATLMENQQ